MARIIAEAGFSRPSVGDVSQRSDFDIARQREVSSWGHNCEMNCRRIDIGDM